MNRIIGVLVTLAGGAVAYIGTGLCAIWLFDEPTMSKKLIER